MRDLEQRAVDQYEDMFGRAPEVVASAPGRVNLIGEHTDYNGGFVLPCAIDRRVAIALGRGSGGLYSADFAELRPTDGEKEGNWVDYPRGVMWALAEAGHDIPPTQAAFAGDVPHGAGLSSSAAIECATAHGFNALYNLGISRSALALLAQRAENGFVGVQCGAMDQLASMLGERGTALFIDCRTLQVEGVPLDLQGAGLTLLICDTRVKRSLGSTAYNDRRVATERAARTLGVEQLRDATAGDLDRLDGEERKRARHVITENDRVVAAVEALRNRDFSGFGQHMYRSHESLRDDYEVSNPELDTFVRVARETGALGARLTGAGFGGCAIALLESRHVDLLTDAVRQEFEGSKYAAPAFYTFEPSEGADVIG